MIRRLLALSLVAAALSSSGCIGNILPSHLHDAERAALTAKLVATLDAYDQSSPTAYEALVKSSRAIAAEQDKVLVELANNREAAVEQLLPFRTYQKLGDVKTEVTTRLGSVEDQVRDGVNRYLQEQKITSGTAATAAKAIQDATDALDRAKTDVTRWNASIAVLQAAVAKLPLVSAPKSGDAQKTELADLAERIKATTDQEVEFVDASGARQKRKIKDILQDQIGVSTDETPGAISDAFRIPDAPGATLTILTLGVDLAKSQKERADARLVQITRRLALYERTLSEVALARVLISEVDFTADPKDVPFGQDAVELAYEARVSRTDVGAALRAGDKTKIRTTIQDSDANMLALFNKLLKLRKLAVADSMSLRAQLALQRDAARLDHEESLLDAQVNDREWKAVLRAGVGVLNQYEQGGFTKEDAANLIRIAQAIALGVIAGKVD